jgi:hypothetical protein
MGLVLGPFTLLRFLVWSIGADGMGISTGSRSTAEDDVDADGGAVDVGAGGGGVAEVDDDCAISLDLAWISASGDGSSLSAMPSSNKTWLACSVTFVLCVSISA